MYKKLLPLALAAALSACAPQAEEPAAALQCDHPAVLQSARSNLQEIIKQQARQFAQNDSRQFVDADKVVAAAAELQLSLNNAAEETAAGNTVCAARLDIRIPDALWQTAQTNSPLLYPDQILNQLIQQRTTGSNLQYDGNGGFSLPLRYTPQQQDGQWNISYDDNSLSNSAQQLTAALLPYGVKDILLINGQAVSRTDALQQQQQPFTDPPPADPQDILDNNAASMAAASMPQTAPLPEAEVLTPTAPAQDEVLFSANELDQARLNNRNADNEINALWNRIDPAVQQRLLGEQRNWIQSKNNSCRQAAAQAGSTLQAEYLQLQCDTRMTRERNQYLRGYAIN